jgi:hypothetical protein
MLAVAGAKSARRTTAARAFVSLSSLLLAPVGPAALISGSMLFRTSAAALAAAAQRSARGNRLARERARAPASARRAPAPNEGILRCP